MNELNELLAAAVTRADALVVLSGAANYGCHPEVQKHADIIRDHASRVSLYLDRAGKNDVSATWLDRYTKLAGLSARVVTDSLNRIDELFPGAEHVARELAETYTPEFFPPNFKEEQPTRPFDLAACLTNE